MEADIADVEKKELLIGRIDDGGNRRMTGINSIKLQRFRYKIS
jgi:hypothetical protein